MAHVILISWPFDPVEPSEREETLVYGREAWPISAHAYLYTRAGEMQCGMHREFEL